MNSLISLKTKTEEPKLSLFERIKNSLLSKIT